MVETKITKNMSIGQVLEKHPSTEKVFLKFFGQGCFTCPGAKMEDIAFGATMHGMDADAIVEELNKVAEGEE
jgi:hybrid cluster-associated redox disulfide protein